MFTAYILVTLLAALLTLYAASNDFRRVSWVMENMDKMDIPRSWLLPLGGLKTAGAVGLIVSFAMPTIGIAAAIGLILFFLGAIGFSLRARWYSHIPIPSVWLVLAAASLVLRLHTR